jgi:quinolinate synthase
VAVNFAIDGGTWNEDRVLERYELAYGAGLVAEAYADSAGAGQGPPRTVGGEPMAGDHRRILATAIARLRGKIKYRPVVFELLPPTFTLLQLQQTVEALAGLRLHKPNFRRLVEQQGLVEDTGAVTLGTGGRPARRVARPRALRRRHPRVEGAERNAVVLAHNYQTPEIFHGVADITGDSLALARKAASTDADVIVMAGVHFMAETAKILSPGKTVLIPDLEAGCSLAESITAADVRLLRERYPGVPVVTYVNTSAEVKAESDVCCTSANAVEVVESLGVPRVIFLPDEYLASTSPRRRRPSSSSGRATARCTSASPRRDPLLPRAAPGSRRPRAPRVPAGRPRRSRLRRLHRGHVRHVGRRPAVAGRPGHRVLDERQRRRRVPDVEFVRPCNLCPHMKRITLPKILRALQAMEHRGQVDPAVAERARRAVERMLAVGAGAPMPRRGSTPSARPTSSSSARVGRALGRARPRGGRVMTVSPRARSATGNSPGRRAASRARWAGRLARPSTPPTRSRWRGSSATRRGRALLTEGPRTRRAQLLALGARSTGTPPASSTSGARRPTPAPGSSMRRCHRRRRSCAPWGGAARAAASVRLRARLRPRALCVDGAASPASSPDRTPTGPAHRGPARSSWPPAASAGLTRARRTRRRPPATASPGLRAPARVLADLEFVQFHPTALGRAPTRCRLLTEALRGAGAVLVDAGRPALHAACTRWRAAPRDVVARAIWSALALGPAGEVPRRARGAGGPRSRSASRRSSRACRQHGLDPRHEPIPVRPAAHYHMGGVDVDLAGRRVACPACGPRARWPAPASTAPTAWPATRCSRRSSSARCSSPRRRGRARRAGADTTEATTPHIRRGRPAASG